MKRRIVFATVLCAAAALVFAADVTRPGATESWFLYSVRGKPVGYLHATRSVSDMKLAPVLLEHEFAFDARGKRLSLKMETWCADDECLSAVKIVSKGEGDDEFGTFTATVERAGEGPVAGTLKVEEGDRAGFTLKIPERTVTDFALFEIVKTLPFDGDKPFDFNSLEASELNLKRDRRLRYVGEEELTVAGKKTTLRKFEHTAAGGRVVTAFWLNDKHEIIRALIDDRKEFLLTTRDKALAALEPEQ